MTLPLSFKTRVVLPLVLLLSFSCRECHAFSAKLSKPWSEGPGGRARLIQTSKTKTRKRIHDLIEGFNVDSPQDTTALQATQRQSHQDEEEDEETMRIEDDEESMLLETSSTMQHERFTNDVSSSHSPPTTVRSSWRQLLGMTRPSNFLGVIVFHFTGTYLATKGTNLLEGISFASLLLKPAMCLVLITLLLTASTSMVVNDYYDAKLGVDSQKTHKPLVSGHVSMEVTKRFLSYLYAATLVGVAFLPGIPARLSVVLATMLTFGYTKHLKPKTWLKNVSCAGLMALTPFTSGAAAVHLLQGASPALTLNNQLSLWSLVFMLFFGFLGREIMMDLNDAVEDRKHLVNTIPVTYGSQFAASMALGATVLMSSLSLLLPLTERSWRRAAFALVGSTAMLRRVMQVVSTGGSNREVVDMAVEEGKHSILLLLASFI